MDTDAVLELVQRVAEEVVNPRFRNLGSGDVASKRRPGDLVTVADREAEELLTAELRRAHPAALVLGEEAVSRDPSLLRAFGDAEHAFTVDPVDGTRRFVKGSPDHAVMLAELRGGEVVRSWIWQPQHHRAYVAERGAGAWSDGQRLRTSDGTTARDLASRAWPRRLTGALRRLRRTYVCCGVDYPWLATGAADYAVFPKTRPWDHAPGSLLLAESGGVVRTLDGRDYRPQDPAPRGLVSACDAETAELVRGLLHLLPGL